MELTEAIRYRRILLNGFFLLKTRSAETHWFFVTVLENVVVILKNRKNIIENKSGADFSYDENSIDNLRK